MNFTLSILPFHREGFSHPLPVEKVMLRDCPCSTSGGIGKSVPSALNISLDPRDLPVASPSGNLSGPGKSLGCRGWISQYLPRLGGARIQPKNIYSTIFYISGATMPTSYPLRHFCLCPLCDCIFKFHCGWIRRCRCTCECQSEH